MMRNMHRTRSTKPLKVNLGPLPVDPRLAFVDRACTLMADGRYGPVRPWRLFINLSDRPEIENDVFLDLTDQRLMENRQWKMENGACTKLVSHRYCRRCDVSDILHFPFSAFHCLGICPASRQLGGDALIQAAEIPASQTQPHNAAHLARGPTDWLAIGSDSGSGSAGRNLERGVSKI